MLVFTYVNEYAVLASSRTLTGLFQVFFAIYMPVWANTFGNSSQQALWMTYLMITSPLGVIMGYLLCGFLSEWRWSFYTQSLLMAPSFIGLIIIPNKYFDVVQFSREQDMMLQNENDEDDSLSRKRKGSRFSVKGPSKSILGQKK